MTTTRKQHSPKFKAQVAVEAIRGEKTLSQLGSQFKVYPIQIAKWRKPAERRAGAYAKPPCLVMTSAPMYGRSTSGMRTLPSFCW